MYLYCIANAKALENIKEFSCLGTYVTHSVDQRKDIIRRIVGCAANHKACAQPISVLCSVGIRRAC